MWIVPTAIFPNTGLDPKQMEARIGWPFERSVTTTVNDIEHIESRSRTLLTEVDYEVVACLRCARRCGWSRQKWRQNKND